MTSGRYTSRVLGTLILSFGAVVLGIGLFRGDQTITHYFELKHSEQVLLEALQNLETENDSLQNEIIKIKASPSYARRVLRDKYHITDKDERIIFYTD